VINRKYRNESGKSLQFSTRKDVVNKTIFRYLRKFYTKDFKKYFDFTKVNSLQKDTFMKKLVWYASMKFGTSTTNRMKIFLLCIIDPKGRYMPLEDKSHGLRNDITGLLYSYNKKKMMKMINHQEFLQLLTHFIHQENIVEEIVKKKGNSEIIKSYVKQIENLKALWESKRHSDDPNNF
jgi:hypothetical protein